MTGAPARLAVVVANVLVGLSAGFFYTYEASVTIGLAEVGDLAYVETFQAINATIRNPAFGLVFFGAIPALALALTLSWPSASPPTRALLAAALVLYLGGLAVTGTGNVPLNEDLAEVTTLDRGTATAARAAFEAEWNRLNLIRTVAIGAAFVALAAVPVVGSTRWSEPDSGDSMGQNR